MITKHIRGFLLTVEMILLLPLLGSVIFMSFHAVNKLNKNQGNHNNHEKVIIKQIVYNEFLKDFLYNGEISFYQASVNVKKMEIILNFYYPDEYIVEINDDQITIKNKKNEKEVLGLSSDEVNTYIQKLIRSYE